MEILDHSVPSFKLENLLHKSILTTQKCKILELRGLPDFRTFAYTLKTDHKRYYITYEKKFTKEILFKWLTFGLKDKEIFL